MNIATLFEQPLPVLEIEEQAIEIKIYKGQMYAGKISVANKGGGTLEGKVFAGKGIKLDKEEIKNNHTTLTYTIEGSVDRRQHKYTGRPEEKIIYSEIVFSTNGGEKVIPVKIEMHPAVLKIDETYIESIEAFYDFWTRNQNIGKQIFVQQEFMAWLNLRGYQYMDIYEQFRKDPIKERGINNFFVFNKLKNNVALSLDSQTIEIIEDPYRPEAYEGKITIQKEGLGYIDEQIFVSHNFIRLEKTNISTADFKDTDTIEIPFYISKESISGKSQTGRITLSQGAGCVTVKIKALKILSVQIEKNYQTHKDVMYLWVKNNTKEKVTIEVIPKDGLAKFEKDTYEIEQELKIPFNVRLSTLQLAQKSIRKVPIFESYIRVKATYKDRKFFEDIKIVLGDFN